MEKSSLFNNMWLFATQQIRLPIILMKMSLIISERNTDLLIPVTSIYLIMQFGTSWKRYSTRTWIDMKTSKVFQQQCHTHRIDWKNNHQIFNQPMTDAIRKSGRIRQCSHCTSNLTTPTYDSTYISIIIDLLFINSKLNMIKLL